MRACKTALRFLTLLVSMIALGTAVSAAQTEFTYPDRRLGDLTYDGKYLYMSTTSGSREILRLDPATGAVLDVIFQNPFVSGHPGGIAADGSGRLFLTTFDRAVCELDTDGRLVVPCFPVPFRSDALAFDGTNLYVGDADGSKVLVTDRRGTELRTFDSFHRPNAMAYDTATGHLWVGNLFAFDALFEITTAGQRVRQCAAPLNGGRFGLAGIAIVGPKFYLAEPMDRDSGEGTRIRIVDRHSLSCTPAIIQRVNIDIKPGAFPNSINLESSGVVPVAILSSTAFDATQIDPSSVTLAGAAVKLIGKGDRYACGAEDVNTDGLRDLICHVVTAQFIIEPGDSVAVLEAKTLAGVPIRGEDSINIVP